MYWFLCRNSCGVLLLYTPSHVADVLSDFMCVINTTSFGVFNCGIQYGHNRMKKIVQDHNTFFFSRETGHIKVHRERHSILGSLVQEW
jgi:hypothetical protein